MKRSSSPGLLPTIKQHNNSMMRPRNKSMKVKSRPPWNDRFFVDNVYNYTSLHPYYKVRYFYINPISNTLISHRDRRLIAQIGEL